MSQREKRLLRFLVDYSVRHNEPPSVAEMCAAARVETLADLYVVLETLTAAGVVKADVLVEGDLPSISAADLALARLRHRLEQLAVDAELADRRALELEPSPGASQDLEAATTRAFARGLRTALAELAAVIDV